LLARLLSVIALALTLGIGVPPPRPALTAPTEQAVTAEQLQAIEDRTVRLRELPQVSPIATGFMRRADVRPHIEASLYRNNTPEEIEANEYRLEILGYVDPGVDIISIYLDVIGEQVLGFYDIDETKLNLVVDSTGFGPNDEITLAHEITHALQDQNYDLKNTQEALRNENDQQLAFQALIEGDATLLMIEYARTYFSLAQLRQLMESDSSTPTDAFDAAPLIIQEELLYPYREGMNFVSGQFSRGSWAAVNQLFQDPPVSTEQILHPEKYLAREGPVPLPMPDLAAVLGPDWRFLEETTLGELDTRILIQQYVNPPTAQAAAAGWGGDRFQTFRRDNDGALFLGMRTAWDTQADAVEFFNAYQRVAAGRHGPALQTISIPPPAAPSTARAADDSWAIQAGPWRHAMIRDGSQVALVISTDTNALSAIQTLR
jgi:DNA-binding transcriptional MerR regulator